MDRLRNLVVPTDFSETAQAAVVRAVGLARLDGATIHLVHAVGVPLIVAPHQTAVPSAVWEGIHRSANERLEALRKETEQQSGHTVTALVRDSYDPTALIAETAEARSADLVVMGTHGQGGLRHALLGSVAERTLRTLATPVLAVKEDAARAEQPIRRILVGVDASPHAGRAAELAAFLARRLSASLELMHVVDAPRDYNPYLTALGTELLQKVEAAATADLEGLRSRLGDGLAVALELRHGDPPTVLAEAAREKDCQLIALGTRGLRGLDHVLLGSVAERTLRAAPCSVLTVRAEDTDGPRPPSEG